jgi:2,5-diketo-D-gluconate reductase A
VTTQIPTIPRIHFGDGWDIPQLGFGLYRIDPTDTARATAAALEQGYRHLDGASIYRNEQQEGEGIRASGVPRDQLFLTSKVWNDAQAPAATLDSLDRTLEHLGTDYLDLYLIHWPAPRFDTYVQTWRTLEQVKQSGLVRSIGVSNFLIPHLERLARETGVVPAVDQIELHPFLQQRELTEYLTANGIVTEAWGPLAQGHPDLLGHPELQRLAEETGREPAQIVLRWHIQLGHVVFPKSTRPERMLSNAQLFDFTLDDHQMTAIRRLDRDLRVGRHPEEQH